MTTLFQRCPLAAVIFTAVMTMPTVHAADSVQPLIEGQGITVTTQDVLGDALRIPRNVRDEVLGTPQTLTQLASNLYVFRTIAKMAQEQGLDQRADVAAAVKIAQERVLADAWLAALDAKSRPDEKAAEVKAKAIYDAENKKFTLPEQVHVRHILIAGADAAAREKAQQVLDALKKGADFSELAIKESADKGSGARGGDLGFFARGSMVAAFEEAAFALKKPGELSGLVETQFGLHILRLEARRDAGKVPFTDVRGALIEQVQSEAMQSARAAESTKIRQYGLPNSSVIEAFAKSRKQGDQKD